MFSDEENKRGRELDISVQTQINALVAQAIAGPTYGSLAANAVTSAYSLVVQSLQLFEVIQSGFGRPTGSAG